VEDDDTENGSQRAYFGMPAENGNASALIQGTMPDIYCGCTLYACHAVSTRNEDRHCAAERGPRGSWDTLGRRVIEVNMPNTLDVCLLGLAFRERWGRCECW